MLQIDNVKLERKRQSDLLPPVPKRRMSRKVFDKRHSPLNALEKSYEFMSQRSYMSGRSNREIEEDAKKIAAEVHNLISRPSDHGNLPVETANSASMPKEARELDDELLRN